MRKGLARPRCRIDHQEDLVGYVRLMDDAQQRLGFGFVLPSDDDDLLRCFQVEIEPAEHLSETERIVLHLVAEQPQRVLCFLEMLLLARIVIEAQEVLRRHRISSWHRMVEWVFGAMEQRLMIGACQEECPLYLIPEIGDHSAVELLGTRQEALVPRRLNSIDQARHEAAMVVEIGWQLRLAIL